MNDDQLEAALREAAGVMDAIPAHLVRSAVEAYMFRTLDEELAEIAFDSMADTGIMRGQSHPWLLTFQAEALSVDVEITAADVGRRIVGQLIPPLEAELEIRTPDSRAVQVVNGRFVVDNVPAGPLSLRIRLGDTVITTEWITV